MKSPHLGRFDPMPLVLGPVLEPKGKPLTAAEKRAQDVWLFENMPHEVQRYATGGVATYDPRLTKRNEVAVYTNDAGVEFHVDKGAGRDMAVVTINVSGHSSTMQDAVAAEVQKQVKKMMAESVKPAVQEFKPLMGRDMKCLDMTRAFLELDSACKAATEAFRKLSIFQDAEALLDAIRDMAVAARCEENPSYLKYIVRAFYAAGEMRLPSLNSTGRRIDFIKEMGGKTVIVANPYCTMVRIMEEAHVVLMLKKETSNAES